MRIREFIIQRYGPIKSNDILTLSPFTLIWGENEDGKTLTIEALLKLLFKKKFKSTNYKSRLDVLPLGEVTVELEKGKSVQIVSRGGGNSLIDFLDISPELFVNLFVINNSDLLIPEEAEVYTEITERLTGIKKSYVKNIIDRLRAMGNLTPRNDFTDSRDSGKLKSRLIKAENLIGEIENFIRFSEEHGFDRLEEELVSSIAEKDAVSKKVSRLEALKREEEYVRYKKLMEDLLRELKAREMFMDYSEEELERIIKANQNLETFKRVLKEREESEAETKRERKTIENSLNEAKTNYGLLESRISDIEKNILPEIGKLNFREERISANGILRKAFVFSSGAFFLLAIIFGVGAFIGNIEAFIPASIGAGGLFLFSILVYLFIFLLPRRMTERKKVHLIHMANSLGLNVKSPQDITHEALRLKDEFALISNRVKDLEIRKGIIDREITKTLNEREELRKKISELKHFIDNVLAKRGIDSIEEYRNGLNRLREINVGINTKKTLLRDRFGSLPSGATKDEYIHFWNDKINSLRVGMDSDTNKILYSDPGNSEYSEEELRRLNIKMQELEDRIAEIRNSLSNYYNKLNYFEREFNGVVGDEGFSIRSHENLLAAMDSLKNFVEDTKKKRELFLNAIEILEEIEQKEERGVEEIFSDAGGVEKYFKEITDGMYVEVNYDSGNGKIVVTRRDGERLYPEKLSGGTFDQLYFSIRLAFGEKIFPENRGFFILDDPFLKSDSRRLKREIKLLVDLAKRGWQIIYFSAKDEIKELVSQEIRKTKGLITVIDSLRIAEYKL